ncbi:MAG: Wzz/FepE/Etk N-terminal domain-containing protein [Burkholderiales bacterium]|nr:Wzz/FepE/Etk N-terminal domain-containing protein [Burkholderiales bacterium]
MQEVLDQILDYLRGIWRRRWVGLAVAWLIAIVGTVVAFRIPDRYEASARVYVDTQSILRPLLSGIALPPNFEQEVAILGRTLISRVNVEKILRKSDLDLVAKTAAERDELVQETLKQLKIARAGGDNLYTITFRYPDPKKSRDVVQAALSVFMEQSLGDKRQDAESARRFIDDQIRAYEEKLREAEARVQAFRLKYMGVLGGSSKDYLTRMSDVAEEIKAARMELRAAEQSRDSMRKQLEDMEKGAFAESAPDAASGIVTPELDARIDAQRRTLDELLRRYTDQHPDVVGTKRLLAQLEEERAKEIESRKKAAAASAGKGLAPTSNPVVHQLRIAQAELEGNVASLRAKLADAESRYAQLRANAELMPKIDTELAQLNRDYEIQKRQYENLVSRRESASLTGELEQVGVAEFRVIDPPRVTPTPVAPNRALLLLGVLAAALAGGVLTSFAVSQVLPTFHDGRLLREVTKRPLLGIVSLVPSPATMRQRRRAALLFYGALGSLLVSYAALLAFAFATNRVA